MKKKTLLLTLLALAIVTSITAGTLAVYTKSVTMDAKVVTKKFAFAAAGKIQGDAESIKLAPGESQSFNFTVTNFDGANSPAAEVPLNYVISVDFAAAADMMPGLTGVLKKGTETVGTLAGGKINYSDTTPQNTPTTHTYVLTLTWVGANNETANEEHSKSGVLAGTIAKGLTITVNATQKI